MLLLKLERLALGDVGDDGRWDKRQAAVERPGALQPLERTVQPVTERLQQLINLLGFLWNDRDAKHGMISRQQPPVTVHNASTRRIHRNDAQAILLRQSLIPLTLDHLQMNQSQDNMGFTNALQACFTLHQLNHSHWATLSDGKRWVAVPEDGVHDWRNAPPVELAEKKAVGGSG